MLADETKPGGLIVILLLTSLFWSCEQKEELKPPNILWIVSEDNSPFIGAYGDDFATTPTLDSLAAVSVLYANAFATTPVCAPSRSTLITGMYSASLGTLPMRSPYPIPDYMRFFPNYLKDAGYYTTNNSKKDYNTVDQPECWDESSNKATYMNRQPGQPFFHVQNIFITHESQIHDSIPWGELKHDPTKVPMPPYHPRTKDMEHDWAQYYDRVEQMDSQVAGILADLKKSGEAENTIVFYYSDHGGVLGRSKRFMYESGLHIPLVINFPEKYKHLAPSSAGSKSDRLVNFADFGPTVLSLAGVAVPDYMQGEAFLGSQQSEPKQYAHAYRGRMDERIDLARSVRDKQFRYIRNYMPHKPNGQHLYYLWLARSMPSWEKAFKNGDLNEVQSRFWLPRPAEELYDVAKDPDNINNLAADPAYANTLLELRNENLRWVKEIRDANFLPEPMTAEISEVQPVFDYVRGKDFRMDFVIETADLASMRDPSALPELIKRLENPNAAVRYWAATGCLILADKSPETKAKLLRKVDDPSVSVRLAVAESLYHLGYKKEAINICKEALTSERAITRLYAANVLEEFGMDALPAKLALEQSLVDSVGTATSEMPKAVNHILDRLN
jgi:N-sulfoglucosamine sulfohydrolase